MTTSPSSENYTIPTGYCTFKPKGSSDPAYDLGNVVNFSISNEITKKDHFKNRGGRRTKDKTRTTQVGATVKFTLDEITAKNIALFALGEVESNSDGTVTISGLSKTDFEGTLKVIGDNEEGTQLDWEGVVSFSPSGDFTFIKDNDDDSQIAIEASVQEDTILGFGKWTVREKA